MTDFPAKPSSKQQFSILGLLLVTAAVGLYTAIAVALIGNHGVLLDAIANTALLFLGLCGLILLSALLTLALNIALSQFRAWAIAGLATAIAYASVSVVVFVAMLPADAFVIFTQGYIACTIFIAPAVVMSTWLAIQAYCGKFDWLTVTGLGLWLLGVSATHTLVIAAAASSI